MNIILRLNQRKIAYDRNFSSEVAIMIASSIQLFGMITVGGMSYRGSNKAMTLQKTIHDESKDLQKTISYQSMVVQKSINRDYLMIQSIIHFYNMKIIKDKHNYTRAKSSFDHIILIKKSLTKILYGSEHRHVSDGMAQVMSLYDQRILETNEISLIHDISDKILRNVADEWNSKYKEVSSKNISIEKKKRNNIYQINIFRSMARDNFIRIYSTFESYSECIAQDKYIIEEQNFKIPELISGGQSRELLNRYNRFVRYIGPIDVAMGYTRNDGEIYNHREFMEKLKSCLHNESDKKALEERYDKLSIESPWYDARC